MNRNRYFFFDQFFPFFVVWKMYGKSKEIYGKSMEMYGNVWKCMEMNGKV